MIKLPDYVFDQLPEGTANRVVYAGRRARYEIVEEVSRSIFIGWLVSSVFLAWWYYAGWTGIYFWLLWALGLLYSARKGFFEYKRWWHEIHLVAQNEVGGGLYIQFSGWLNRAPKIEPITATSPSILGPKQPWDYRLWGYLTGERMCFVSLHSDNGPIIKGNKVSPDLVKAILAVRTRRPDWADSQVTPRLKDTEIIAGHVRSGMIPEQEGKNMVLTIAREVTWGGQ